MLSFEFQNPVKIIFGKDSIKKLGKHLPKDKKILMVYGGGSIKKNFVYDEVKAQLEGLDHLEFSGIPANPEYEVLMQGVELIKQEKIEFILAVGGGSVIDGVKFLTAAALYPGDPWEIVEKRIPVQENEALPFATVLTLPATASEMNSGSVISRRATGQKLGMGGPGLFPSFSILDPMVVESIPKRQIANGIADAYTHVLEQYMTYPAGSHLQDRFCEAIMLNLQELAPKVLSDTFDENAASEFMWSCTMALNGLIGKGVPTDWAVHSMGHELTAQFGIDHARTLAIVAPSHYRYYFDRKKEKLAQYAMRVWDIQDGSVEEKAQQAILKMENFFHSIGIDTRLSQYTENYEGSAEKVKDAFTGRGWTGLGEHKDLGPDDAQKIIEMSY